MDLIETILKPSILEKPTNHNTNRQELHRPQFHFTPKRNWMNDPNGLIKYRGVYHLYFQHNPYANQWGHMSWGHATSIDLVHWTEHKVAIPEAEHMIFSGTTALALDEETLIAAFTSFEYSKSPDGKLIAVAQNQSIAKSHDGGFTYQELDHNPVLDIGSTEFRDPKLFFDTRTRKWNMLVCLADEHKVLFYQSLNLKDWTKVSEFGPKGNTSAVWECPDLFELEIDGSYETKWVLTVSAGHPQAGYLGMQYFIGDFDGTDFIADDLHYPLYLDYGKDFYAGQTFANTRQKQKAIMLGWVGSHLYNSHTPTEEWRGVMSLPRDLVLTNMDGGHRLLSKPPLHYLSALLTSTWSRQRLLIFNGLVEVPVKSKSFVISLNVTNRGIKTAGVKLLKSSSGETVVGVDFENQQVFVDRRKSSKVHFHQKFAGVDAVPLETSWHSVKLDIFVDHSLMEVFIQNGTHTITNLIFPDADGDSIELFSDQQETLFEDIQISTVKSIWK